MKNKNRKKLVIALSTVATSAALVITAISFSIAKNVEHINAGNDYYLALTKANAYSGTDQYISTASKKSKVLFHYEEASVVDNAHVGLKENGIIRNDEQITSITYFSAEFTGSLKARLSYDKVTWGDYFDLTSEKYVHFQSKPYYIEIKAIEATVVKTVSYSYSCSANPDAIPGHIPTETGAEYETTEIDINLIDEIGKPEDLNGWSKNYHDIIFSFSKETGQYSPKSVKDGKPYYVVLYTNNTMTLSGQLFTKVEFDFVGGKVGPLTVNSGSIACTNTSASWTGQCEELIFTATGQTRFNTISITYAEEITVDPVLEGVSTIREVYQAADQIKYKANNSGWYLSNVEVELEVEAIDAIDSVSTGKEYDGNARGKVLVADATGTIICSSSTSTSNPISFYQRVKDYIKAGTTQYHVSGYIAFFNGVVEVKVSEYQYDSELVIEKDYEGYVKDSFGTSEEFVNYVTENIIVNDSGYGVGKVVKMNGLTLINKYNSAGSYLFTDRDGNIVPVYSLDDKDRTLLNIGEVYDVIGLSSRYRYRPSLRILKVYKSDLEAVNFDFVNNVTEVSNLNQFYNIGEGDSEDYVKSELTVYKADVYVSRYEKDKYTFNTSYYYNSSIGEYTTGSNEVDAAQHHSLGIFNENLDYKQVLLDFVIDNCKSTEEVEASKVTLYFTLAYFNKVDSKNMWRVNIFEDLVFGLDYASSQKASMTFDTNEANCDREDGVYQEWSNSSNAIVVRNESTKSATIERKTDYLKVVDSTRLIISFDQDIIAFTLYTGTYSSIASFGSFGDNVKAYIQRASYTFVVLKEKTKVIDIDELYVSSTGNTDYLKVISIDVNY